MQYILISFTIFYVFWQLDNFGWQYETNHEILGQTDGQNIVKSAPTDSIAAPSSAGTIFSTSESLATTSIPSNPHVLKDHDHSGNAFRLIRVLNHIFYDHIAPSESGD